MGVAATLARGVVRYGAGGENDRVLKHKSFINYSYHYVNCEQYKNTIRVCV